MRPLWLRSYLSVNDVIKVLPMSKSTFYRWAKTGKFKDLVSKDKESGIYYVYSEDVSSIKELLFKKDRKVKN